MAYQLQMSDEIHDWLANLPRTDPSAASPRTDPSAASPRTGLSAASPRTGLSAAMLVGQALVGLMSAGAALGAPLVVSPADAPRPGELAEALDLSYQDRLERLTIARRREAEAAELVRDLQDQIAEQGRAAAARRLLPGAIEAEKRLREQRERLQARIDAFGARREVLKATYTAARAELAVHEVIADQPGDDRGERAEPGEDISDAVARLRRVTAEIERELAREPRPEDLLELRPGAPGDGEIRILFAAEPPGTALLIAVLDGRQAIRDHYREAITLSADVLRRVRAGLAPEASAHGYDDPRSFLDEFYPGRTDEMAAAAAALVAGNRARTLAGERIRLGLTQAEVAQRMGVRQERVSAIERAEPGATEVRTLASYVAALGGRLEIIAEIGGERVLLR